jgi:hypothetical protein
MSPVISFPCRSRLDLYIRGAVASLPRAVFHILTPEFSQCALMSLGGRKFAERVARLMHGNLHPDSQTPSRYTIHETHRFYEIDVIGRLALAHVITIVDPSSGFSPTRGRECET